MDNDPTRSMLGLLFHHWLTFLFWHHHLYLRQKLISFIFWEVSLFLIICKSPNNLGHLSIVWNTGFSNYCKYFRSAWAGFNVYHKPRKSLKQKSIKDKTSANVMISLKNQNLELVRGQMEFNWLQFYIYWHILLPYLFNTLENCSKVLEHFKFHIYSKEIRFQRDKKKSCLNVVSILVWWTHGSESLSRSTWRWLWLVHCWKGDLNIRSHNCELSLGVNTGSYKCES